MFDQRLKDAAFKAAVKQVAKHYPGPCLILSPRLFEEQYRRIDDAVGEKMQHYISAKSLVPQAHVELLGRLRKAGHHVRLDVASAAELAMALALGIAPQDIVYTNPVFDDEVLEMFAELESPLRAISVHSIDGIIKLAAVQQKSGRILTVMVRYAHVNAHIDQNTGQFSKKYGVPKVEVVPLALFAEKLGLDCVGLHVHIGTQNPSVEPWVGFFADAQEIWQDAEENGLSWNLLDIGGGTPGRYTLKDETIFPAPEDYLAAVVALPGFSWFTEKGIQVIHETGRGVSNNAGVMLGKILEVKPALNGVLQVAVNLGVLYGMLSLWLIELGAVYPQLVELGAWLGDWREAKKRTRVTVGGYSSDSADAVYAFLTKQLEKLASLSITDILKKLAEADMSSISIEEIVQAIGNLHAHEKAQEVTEGGVPCYGPLPQSGQFVIVEYVEYSVSGVTGEVRKVSLADLPLPKSCPVGPVYSGFNPSTIFYVVIVD